jgi:hypothetical protein
MVPDLPGAKLASGVKDQLITLSGSLYPITLFEVTSLTEVEGIVARVLSNQDEVKRLSEQVVKQKMLELFQQKANPTVKVVTYAQFVKEMYGE